VRQAYTISSRTESIDQFSGIFHFFYKFYRFLASVACSSFQYKNTSWYPKGNMKKICSCCNLQWNRPITDKTSNAIENLLQEQNYSGAAWYIKPAPSQPFCYKLSTCDTATRKYTCATKLEIALHYGDETSYRSMSNANVNILCSHANLQQKKVAPNMYINCSSLSLRKIT
jgi:hypothetical protein